MKYAKDVSLIDYINSSPTKSEQKAKKIIGQLLMALNFMHQNNLVHRDIKPANILVMDLKELIVCIADLGLTHSAKKN
jgi:serine/threonine protein kinase